MWSAKSSVTNQQIIKRNFMQYMEARGKENFHGFKSIPTILIIEKVASLYFALLLSKSLFIPHYYSVNLYFDLPGNWASPSAKFHVSLSHISASVYKIRHPFVCGTITEMSSILTTDFLLFAVSAGLFLLHRNGVMGSESTSRGSAGSNVSTASSSTCDASVPINSAFVFVKPHANTIPTQDMVRKTLIAKGVTIVEEGDIASEEIDEKKLIDQHYYAIGK
jgi:hypothetical protein